MNPQRNYLTLKKKIQDYWKKNGRGSEIPTLLPVTKKVEPNKIQLLYDVGCRAFAESYLQEALLKINTLPSDIEWHFIGHLQKNKVSKVVDHFKVIHSIDSYLLAEKISKAAIAKGKIIEGFLQINVSNKKEKYGLLIEDVSMDQFFSLEGIQWKGLMVMADVSNKGKLIKGQYKKARQIKDKLVDNGYLLPHLSMGMSQDFLIAIEQGASYIRLGTAIFGERQ